MMPLSLPPLKKKPDRNKGINRKDAMGGKKKKGTGKKVDLHLPRHVSGLGTAAFFRKFKNQRNKTKKRQSRPYIAERKDDFQWTLRG